MVANFNPILGIDDFSDTPTFKIYPNPSNCKVIIETEFEGNLKVYNLLGQLIISSKITERQTEIEIYVSGFYQLILIDLYGNKTNAKLIINR
ncbi:T9SS type A sorting domain-containing protein [Confluentibacter flavum]|uniref:T9SS type A sorting domain-containing protein n=1 Tax=Confluentibacter flavum TaxID=1909700 RepID=UPI0012FF34DB